MWNESPLYGKENVCIYIIYKDLKACIKHYSVMWKGVDPVNNYM